MAITISMFSQNGGSGRTTTAISFAEILGSKRCKVLLIDMNAESNATYASGINLTADTKTVTDVLGEDCSVKDAAIPCKYYDMLAGDIYLRNVEGTKVPSDLLKKVLAPAQQDYDFIIIDTPFAYTKLYSMSLVASNYVLIPSDVSAFSSSGIVSSLNIINDIKMSFDLDLEILGILLIKYNNNIKFHNVVKKELRKNSRRNGISLFKHTIRGTISVPEAQILQKPLIDYAKNSSSTIDYQYAVNEMLKKLFGFF